MIDFVTGGAPQYLIMFLVIIMMIIVGIFNLFKIDLDTSFVKIFLTVFITGIILIGAIMQTGSIEIGLIGGGIWLGILFFSGYIFKD